MLIVVLLGAIVFYATIYLLWEASFTRLDSMEAWLRAVSSMLWMPEPVVFLVLRGLILATAFYVFADWMLATSRTMKRRSQERRERQEAPVLRFKEPHIVE